MRKVSTSVLAAVIIAVFTLGVSAQNPAPSSQQQAQAEKAFAMGNTLMEQRKPGEALVHYKQALAILPDEPSILFNAGVAAFGSKDYAYAAESWKQLKAVEPLDWHTRAKLIQVYQALGKLPERDKERAELFEMWKSGKSAELKKQTEYCRDQFEVKGQKVMAFELYELKGDRALRYVFSILNKTEDGEEWRISMGSYKNTDAVWRELQNPKPKDHERLFHLDGYFKNGGHATYGMFFPEPSYDDIRAKVIKILEGTSDPISTTTPAQPITTPKPSPH